MNEYEQLFFGDMLHLSLSLRNFSNGSPETGWDAVGSARMGGTWGKVIDGFQRGARDV